MSKFSWFVGYLAGVPGIACWNGKPPPSLTLELVSEPSLCVCVCVCVCVLVAQSCPTLCDPMDSSLPDFSVHRILQARILEWIAIPFSRRTSQPRGQTLVSYITGIFFTIWATGKSYLFSRWPHILMAHLNKIGLIQLPK